MKYINKDKIPLNKLPIYLCNVLVYVCELKKKNKIFYSIELEKVVLKGITEQELKVDFIKKKKRKIFTKAKLNRSIIKLIKIELLINVGFGIIE